MTIFTVEFQGHDGSEAHTFYLSDGAYNTSPADTPPNTHFRPGMKEKASFEQSLSVSGEATIGFGQIVFINADRRYDDAAEMAFDGRPCVVKVLEDRHDTYADAPVAIDGTIEDIDITDAYTLLRIRLYDKLLDLDKPLLTARYGGTTLGAGATADGDRNLKGAIIKRCYGECLNFEADLANPFNLIWQLSDKPLVSAAAYDGGMALDATSDYASLADLVAATVAPGEYATALNTGTGAYVRLGGRPLLQLTFDAVAGATEADRSAAAIAKQVLLDFGIDAGDIDDDAFGDLHDANEGVCGLRIVDEETAKATVQRVLRSVTGWLLPDGQGNWIVGRIEAPAVSASREFFDWQLLGEVKRVDPQDGQQGIPVWRVVARYRYLGRAHTDAELDTDITQERRDYLIGPNVYREVTAEDATVKDVHLRAGEIVLETCFADDEDAQAEADRILALRKVKRSRWQFSVDERYARGVGLGDTIRLTTPRFLASGRNFVVLRRLLEIGTRKVTFDVWG